MSMITPHPLIADPMPCPALCTVTQPQSHRHTHTNYRSAAPDLSVITRFLDLSGVLIAGGSLDLGT